MAQFFLIIENRVVGILETTIRFFSFFTILTNILVALFLTLVLRPTDSKLHQFFAKPGRATALTLYILIVGGVYQSILRFLWEPTGLQRIVDEVLHSVTPVVMLVYWIFFEAARPIRWTQIPSWLLFPVGYLIYVLVRGSYASWYPYPFVDAGQLSVQQLATNVFGLVGVFVVGAFALAAIGKLLARRARHKIL